MEVWLFQGEQEYQVSLAWEAPALRDLRLAERILVVVMAPVIEEALVAAAPPELESHPA